MTLTAERILSDIKRAINEGSDDFLSFKSVSKEDVDLVINSLDQNFEGCVRISYNSLDRTLEVKTIVALSHEVPSAWFSQQVVDWVEAGLTPAGLWRDLDRMGPGRHSSFIGQYTSSVKEPDFQILRAGAPYPSIVIETGWSASMAQLERNRLLWMSGSGHQVRVVILVKYYRPNVQGLVKAKAVIWRASPGTAASSETIELFPEPNPLPAAPPDLPAAPPAPQTILAAPPVVVPPAYYISMDELFAGQVPIGISPATRLPLDFGLLRQMSRRYLARNGYQAA